MKLEMPEGADLRSTLNVTEQVEEEDSVGAVGDKLKLIGSDSSGLFVLDQELGNRLPPSAE